MGATCFTCGAQGPVEGHHVAGRVNHPDLVVSVCLDCHLILTNWQYTSGIPLNSDTDTHDLDRHRALIVGTLHLVQLLAQRHDDGWLTAELAALTARACSKVLDETADPHRPGRWLPDPTCSVRAADAVSWDRRDEDQDAGDAQMVEFVSVLMAFGQAFGTYPVLTAARLRDIATRPGDFRRAFDVIVRDHAAAGVLAARLGAFIETCDDLVRRLLDLPDEPLEDENLALDGAACLLAGWRFVQTAFDLADEVLAAEQRGESW